MKFKWLFGIVIIGCLSSCTPSLYMTVENHTGSNARMDIFFSGANSFFKIKGPDVKSVELEGTAINALVEYSFGSGSWDDDSLDKLTQGMDRLVLTSPRSLTTVEKDDLKSFFEDRIMGDYNNGIKVVIE